MINKDFLTKIFEAFSIQRWTDLIRPFSLIEMDMAAEHMMIVFIIGKYEEHKGQTIDWQWIIYASLFDLLKKIALCDIKSPVQAMIKNKYPTEYIKVNKWVANLYKDIINDEELFAQFKAYLLGETFPSTSETRDIFIAAHKYASLRELQMITFANERQRWDKIEKELYADLKDYLGLQGLQLLLTRQKPFDLLLKIEQMRFQVRWNQTPRIPLTSVLGHCYFVAIVTLLLSRLNKSCDNVTRLYDNFFCALFHDLPEAVTRDIISPVKQATTTLPSIVKMIESEVVESELVPFMEDFYKDELIYFTSEEFLNRIRTASSFKEVSYEDLARASTKEQPIDGRVVRLADHIAALLEANISIACGIRSKQLEDGRDNLLAIYANNKIINGINASELFAILCR